MTLLIKQLNECGIGVVSGSLPMHLERCAAKTISDEDDCLDKTWVIFLFFLCLCLLYLRGGCFSTRAT